MPTAPSLAEAVLQFFVKQYPAEQLLDDLRAAARSVIESDGASRPTEEFRDRINAFVVKLVHAITKVECVFVRKTNTDGSAMLADRTNQVQWFPDQLRSGKMPPLFKLADGGVSTYFLNRGELRPQGIPDVFAASPEVRSAHARTLALAAQEDYSTHENVRQQVQEFVKYIRAEYYIPLVANQKVFALIIAISGIPHDPKDVEQNVQALQDWQELLSFLYFVALELEHETKLHGFVAAASKVAFKVGSSLTDGEFLRKMATVLTCHKGLEWHRALIFTFDGPFPSDATCVMAVGGIGDPKWSVKHAALSLVFESLDDYLAAAEDRDFGCDDPLYQLSQRQLLRITCDQFAGKPGLNFLFSASTVDKIGDLEDGGVVWLRKGDIWLQQLTTVEAAFPKAAQACDHCLIPLINIRSSLCEPIGFVILDNPYAHCVEEQYTPGLARLICDVFANHLASRGAGIAGWIADIRANFEALCDAAGSATWTVDNCSPDIKAAVHRNLGLLPTNSNCTHAGRPDYQ